MLQEGEFEGSCRGREDLRGGGKVDVVQVDMQQAACVRESSFYNVFE